MLHDKRKVLFMSYRYISKYHQILESCRKIFKLIVCKKKESILDLQKNVQ